jgi:hypothetical protein
MNMNTILGSLSLVFFTAAVYFWIQSMRSRASVIEILTAEEMQRVISEDADNYYDKFHRADYKVRKVKNKKSYLAKISKSGCSPDEEIVEKIKKCIDTVHELLLPRKNETIHGIKIETFLFLPWRIGFTCDKNYENGLPHTRGDVIILNTRDIQQRTIPEVCKLLIHEKSHVYQKLEDVSHYLKKNYTEIKQKDYKDEAMPANPDTNDTVYKCNKTDTILGGKYAEHPTHFRDISFPRDDHSLEHPFESMAYKMEELYDQGAASSSMNTSESSGAASFTTSGT